MRNPNFLSPVQFSRIVLVQPVSRQGSRQTPCSAPPKQTEEESERQPQSEFSPTSQLVNLTRSKWHCTFLTAKLDGSSTRPALLLRHGIFPPLWRECSVPSCSARLSPRNRQPNTRSVQV